jgi:pimeloyl-ACP methyl ester carboxylesterase
MIQVGYTRLHLNCIGEGEPTVVLEALSGGFSTEWAWVQPEIAGTTRVCSYDRAGRPWSDPHAPGDLWETAETLHALLGAADVRSPYILAGHSIGGLYVRAFQDHFPDEVVGIALVDASSPGQFDRFPELAEGNSTIENLLWTFPWVAHAGLFRYYFSSGGEIDFQDLPPRAHDEMAAIWCSPRFFESLIDEVNLANEIFAQARALKPLGDLPLAVVTAEKQPKAWFMLQDELAALSTRSQHVIVAGATHSSLALHPDHARQTSSAILSVVEQARQARSAPSAASSNR